jgi:hypothetical protein
VGGKLDLAALVVEPTLRPSIDSADRANVRLVEVGDGLVVLALSILDHEPAAGIVGVHRQAAALTVASRVADKPVEAMLPLSALAENLVAQLDNVCLVRVRTGPTGAHGGRTGLGVVRDVRLAGASKPIFGVAVDPPALDKSLLHAWIEQAFDHRHALAEVVCDALHRAPLLAAPLPPYFERVHGVESLAAHRAMVADAGPMALLCLQAWAEKARAE